MHRFFISPELITARQVTFPNDLAHQIVKVLRLGEGDQVAVLDNSGHVHQVRLGPDQPGITLVGEIIATDAVTTEPNCHVSLFFGLSNREKVEWILQKGTEIGVSAFYPFLSSRTLVQSSFATSKKLARWKRIIREASEQSGRGRLPELHQPNELTDCLAHVSVEYPLSLLAWEDAQAEGETLSILLEGFAGRSLALFVGPEGGFSGEEVKLAQKAGCQVVSLGKRILRMETAAMIFPALVLFALRA